MKEIFSLNMGLERSEGSGKRVNKRWLLITFLLVSFSLISQPAFAATGLSAEYGDGVVTVSVSGLTPGLSYTVRIVDLANGNIAAMRSVTAAADGTAAVTVTTGELKTLSGVVARLNTSEGTLAAECAVTRQEGGNTETVHNGGGNSTSHDNNTSAGSSELKQETSVLPQTSQAAEPVDLQNDLSVMSEFKDMETHWANEAVKRMASRKIISGVGNGLYEPDRDITRAEFAAVMVRALGIKSGSEENPFADVQDRSWYSEYVRAAYEYEIITGYEHDTFGPMEKLTREQAFSIIARAAAKSGLKSELQPEETTKLVSAFDDQTDLSAWARNAAATCLNLGIVSGKSKQQLAPRDAITRAEVAVIMDRYLQKINGLH